MTSGATVDRDQIAALRRLRGQLGADQIEVLEVHPSPELLPVVGEQTSLTEEQR